MCKSHRSSTEIHIGVISHDGCSTNRISFPASTQGFHCPRPRAVALFRTLKFFSRPRCFFSPIPNVFFLSSFHFYQNKRKSQTRMQNAFAALYFPGPKKKTSLQGYLSTPFFVVLSFHGSRNAPISAICRLHLRIYTHAKGKKKRERIPHKAKNPQIIHSCNAFLFCRFPCRAVAKNSQAEL